MRFALIHMAASYLLALSGFSALALSGELPPLAIAATLVLGAASLFVEPGRHAFASSRAWIALWNVLSIAVFAGTALAVVRGEAFLLSGAQALCFLLVNKLFNRRGSRDYLQIYVLSFLMLVAGTALNTNLVFAACFLAYVVCATWALALLHLRREIEENTVLKHREHASERIEIDRVLASRRVVGARFLALTSLMSAAIFAVSTVFFFAFPRVSWNAFFQNTRRGLAVGFNDRGVNLGENGVVKDNEQVVMRVEFPDGKPDRTLYFRGISFERYRGGRWTPSPLIVRHPLRRWSGMSIAGVPYKRAPLDHRATARRLEGALHQLVYLEPMEASVLFAASTPVALSTTARNVNLGISGVALDGAWLAHDSDENGYSEHATGDIYAWRPPGGLRYEAWSQPAVPSGAPAVTAAPSPQMAAELAEYLEVAAIPPRVVALARRLTDGAEDPAGKMAAIQRHLAAGFRYSLRLVHDPRKEPIEEFLFDRREGHCEYFASAMALLGRAAGVPTRHVAGFYGGEWNELGRYLRVRQRDAHAWVEAWLGPEAGWVTYDPTPPGTGGDEQPGWTDRLRQMLDMVELAWFKYVIEYDLTAQIDLLGKMRRWLSRGPQPGGGAARTADRGAWPDLRRPLAIGGGALMAAVALRLAWRRFGTSAGGRSRRRRRSAERASRAIERAMRAIERRGCARAASDTPRAFLRRARERDDPGASAFADLVTLYYAVRFGDRMVDPGELSALAERVARPPPASPAVTALTDGSDGFDHPGTGR